MSFRRRSEGLGRAKVACDACRHKKAKCDGLVPCTRCRDGRNDDICCYSRRIESSEQVFSALYVKMLRRQLHITLSSLRFLVERIAMDKDCRTYVPELDTPTINTVISLIQESPEFDEEQGKEFSEMSDSELTMLSPQELPYQPVFTEDTKEDLLGAAAERPAKAEPKPGGLSQKRRSVDAEHESGEDAPPKPARGRPRKIKRTQSVDTAAPLVDTHASHAASQHSSAGSTPLLTPVSVRSDAGGESPLRRATYPRVALHAEHGSPEHDAFSIPLNKTPVFAPVDYQAPTLPHAPSELEAMCMGTVMEDESMAPPPMQMDRAGPGVLPDAGPRAWTYAARAYEAPMLNDQMDFFAVDDCLPNWPMQTAAPAAAVSLNDLEYPMPR